MDFETRARLTFKAFNSPVINSFKVAVHGASSSAMY
jgi:hypothetical protein